MSERDIAEVLLEALERNRDEPLIVLSRADVLRAAQAIVEARSGRNNKA